MGTKNGTDVVDPRAEISHDIATGQVYEDSRTGDEYRLVYTDAHTALLRYTTDDGQTKHILETRGQFEENVGAGRFSMVEPGDGSPRTPDEFESVRTLALRLRDHFAGLGSRTGQHKAEGMSEFLDELDDLANGEYEEFDFESVPGVGAKAAENLRDAGFHTAEDVRRADRERIESIPLMGESNTRNILDEVE